MILLLPFGSLLLGSFCMLPLSGGDPQSADLFDCSASVFEAPPSKPQPPDLVAVEAQMREAGIVRAAFHQNKKITALRRPLKSSGRFLFAPDKGIYWQTLAPIQNLFVLSPKGILQKSEDAEPVVIETKEQPVIHGFIQIFMSLFGGDTSELEQRFDLYFTGNADAWTIGLRPKGTVMKKLFDHILLCGGQNIEQVLFLERSGDETRIIFEIDQEGPSQLTAQELANFQF